MNFTIKNMKLFTISIKYFNKKNLLKIKVLRVLTIQLYLIIKIAFIKKDIYFL